MADELPINFAVPAEQAIASYDWADIITGQGFLRLYPTKYKESYSNFIMTTEPLASMATSGLISSSVKYVFSTPEFKVPLNIKGDVYLSVYATNTVALTAKLKKRSSGSSEIGTSTTTSAAEVTHATTGETLKKTITVNDYVNSVTYQQHSDTSVGTIKHRFYSYEGETWDVTANSTVTAYANATCSNTYTDKLIAKIEVYLTAGGTGDTVYYKNADVIAQNLHVSDLTNNITSASATNQMISMVLPLNSSYSLSIGEKLLLELTIAGGGSITLDPNNNIETHESLKINLPVKIQL